MRWTRLTLTISLGSVLWAQGSGRVILPRRSKAEVPKVIVTGVLREITAERIVVQAQDTRVITAKLEAKTAYYRNGDLIKREDFHPGDQVRVEATEDENAFLHAVDVIWQGAATPAPAAEPRAENPPPEKPATRATPAAARPDDDDSGPPRIKRGAPAPKVIPLPADDAVVTPAPAPAAEAPPKQLEDPLIIKAREAVASFTERLPNYFCKQLTTRYQSDRRPASWSPLDVISADVVYEDGAESYRNLAINGKATGKKMDELSGSWSKGEFASVLADLFSPASAVEFFPRSKTTIAGVQADVYNFSVELEHSHWPVYSGSQMIRPAYRGTVWIDPRNARVLRFERQARKLPDEFPLDQVEAAVDYEYIRLGGNQYLLPVHAEILGCQRGSSTCSRNAIDFRNYHLFEGKSDITFK